MRTRSAVVLGASGLVGGELLDRLLGAPEWGRVVAVGRRPLAREHPKLAQRVVDFERLAEAADAFAVDDVFCCLGTTIRQAGSQAAFRRVDHDYPLEAARLALNRGAEQYLLVSAIGADAGARVFYNRVKGEVERDVAALALPRVVIVRPSLLLGERAEFRLGERVAAVGMRVAAPLLVGPLRKYRAVEARSVAAAMVRLTRERGRGVRVVESDEIARLGA